ncbi:zinc finger protein 184-like isoform X2 [Thalassophryne amazonica]|uniref:zinc finger protein 184-like isoform X2 n=1 Tax=Thalassophryne amazonica TaxID=390379 RepID=UPI00147247B9|nr:zinc finger protein 184-like isoform X2 [Thalassophryne amazonica]
MDCCHNKLLNESLKAEVTQRNADIVHMLEAKEEVVPEQQDGSSRLDQEDPDHLAIKEEQEELQISQDREQLQRLQDDDVIKFTLTHGHVKGEDESLQLSELKSREAEPGASSSDRYVKTESDGGEPDPELHPAADEKTHSSDADTDNSDDWEPSCQARAGSNSPCKKVSVSQRRRHSGQKQYICSECEKTFHYTWDLKSHMRCHTGEKPFSCSFCAKRFRQSAHVVSHMRIHTGEKPHVCSVCNQSFTQKTHLTVHMKVHTGGQMFGCSVCKKSYSRKSYLKSHKCKVEYDAESFLNFVKRTSMY